MDQRIISRSEAKAQGLKTYLTGKPCKHGHVAIRQTSNGGCRECSDARDKQWRQKNSDYIRKRNLRDHADYYARNQDRVRNKTHDYYEANKPMVLAKQREYHIRRKMIDYVIGRLEREIQRLDDWVEISGGLVTPKKRSRG